MALNGLKSILNTFFYMWKKPGSGQPPPKCEFSTIFFFLRVPLMKEFNNVHVVPAGLFIIIYLLVLISQR